MKASVEDRRERVVLVGLARTAAEVPLAEESLEELAALADTAGAREVARFVQVRQTPDPATYIGKGKAKEVVDQARDLRANAIIFDDELAPAQGRNLEDLAGVNPLSSDAMKIIDRTGLILDVFSQHARSAEGKLQVELAQINYMVPRLRGWGDVMSRIGGASASLGTRGPGETKLEVDRRRISRRLIQLRKELKELERTRRVKRGRRAGSGITQICLVGYTNAGKSTLLNRLTGAGVLVQDQLFSTLDPVVRKLELSDGKQAVLVDTVGFVRKLPHQLVEAFRSTLEETVLSDFLLQVVDASTVDPQAQMEAVERVLSEISAERIPRVIAFNKADLIGEEDRDRLTKLAPGGVFVSASTGEGIDVLLETIAYRLDLNRTVGEFLVPFDRGDVVSKLYEEGEVLDDASADEGRRLRVRTSPAVVKRYGDYLIGESGSSAATAGLSRREP